MNKNNILLALVVCGIYLLSFSCVPPSDEVQYNLPKQDMSNPLAQRIMVLQSEQNLDSLLYFAEHPDPMARFCATRAFASFLTPAAHDMIRKRLKDSIAEIQIEAAYAAGQSRDSSMTAALLEAFQSNTTKEVNTELNKVVLEAIGKSGGKSAMNLLTSASAFPIDKDKLNEGKAHALFHFGRRGMFNDKATRAVLDILTNKHSAEAKMMASNYFARTPNLDLKPYKFQLLQALLKEEDPNVRMNLASAVAQTGETDIITQFFDFLKNEKDYRVVVNALRKISNFPYIQVIDPVLKFTEDPNEQIALTAVDYLKNHGQASDASFYLKTLDKIKNKRVKLALQGAVLNLYSANYAISRGRLVKTMQEDFAQEKNAYRRSDMIQAIGANPYLYEKVHELGYADSSMVVKSKAVEMLGNVMVKFLPSRTRSQQRYFAPKIMKYMNQALNHSDVGMIAAAAYALAATDVKLIEGQLSRDTLMKAMQGLELPKDIEAMNYLIEAHNKHFPAQKMKAKSLSNYRSLDMESLNRLQATKFVATINTDKGEIQVELFPDHAPETCLNFMDLVEQSYYDNKFFHRVVPNFVLQAGCPRGDGYGSENHVIHSELSPMRYDDAGYIGMASAGKHTECTQWFITHTPTPHLNGNYTIFGKVVKGMDIADEISVGDQIKNIKIIDIPILTTENSQNKE